MKCYNIWMAMSWLVQWYIKIHMCPPTACWKCPCLENSCFSGVLSFCSCILILAAKSHSRTRKWAKDLHLQCDAQTKKGAHHPLSSLQLLTIIIIIFLVPRNHLYPINTFCLPMHFTSAVYTVLFFPCLDWPRVFVSSFFLSSSNFICLCNWV